MKKVLMALVATSLPLAGFSQDVDLEPITVEKEILSAPSESWEYIPLESVPDFSPESVIDYSSSIDLTQRSPFGVQQDVSLRGSMFEDTSIRLKGIEINDPQTGHYSLEIPLTSADIEGVEIFKNSQIINFKVKEPKTKGVLLKTTFGQHALWGELLSFNFPLNTAKNRVSIEHTSSSGGAPDTDFEIYNFSFNSLWQKDGRELEFLFGSTRRDFGADSFYSSGYTQQEEHLDQRFFLLRAALEEERVRWRNSLYFRRHSDKFILNRHDPAFYTNYHTTYIYGLESKLDFKNDLFLAFELEREKITSTNLGNHHRLKSGFSLGMEEKRFGDFTAGLKAGMDYYSDWHCLESATAEVGYFLIENLKLRLSFDRLWRIPSFTELYYSSPANVGNSDLKAQTTNNFEVGFDYFPYPNIDVLFSVFRRDQSDTIDWVRDTTSDPWQAENVGNLTNFGFDFYTEARLENCFLEKISLGYTYLKLDRDKPYSFSKYAFNYNRHKVVKTFRLNIKGIYLDIITKFANPVDRGKYTTFDFRAEKTIGRFIFTLEGLNIFNEDYQEMAGVEGSGRWYKISVTYSF